MNLIYLPSSLLPLPKEIDQLRSFIKDARSFPKNWMYGSNLGQLNEIVVFRFGVTLWLRSLGFDKILNHHQFLCQLRLVLLNRSNDVDYFLKNNLYQIDPSFYRMIEIHSSDLELLELVVFNLFVCFHLYEFESTLTKLQHLFHSESLIRSTNRCYKRYIGIVMKMHPFFQNYFDYPLISPFVESSIRFLVQGTLNSMHQLKHLINHSVLDFDRVPELNQFTFYHPSLGSISKIDSSILNFDFDVFIKSMIHRTFHHNNTDCSSFDKNEQLNQIIIKGLPNFVHAKPPECDLIQKKTKSKWVDIIEQSKTMDQLMQRMTPKERQKFNNYLNDFLGWSLDSIVAEPHRRFVEIVRYFIENHLSSGVIYFKLIVSEKLHPNVRDLYQCEIEALTYIINQSDLINQSKCVQIFLYDWMKTVPFYNPTDVILFDDFEIRFDQLQTYILMNIKKKFIQ